MTPLFCATCVPQHWHKTPTKTVYCEFCCVWLCLAIVSLQVALEAQEDFYRLMARGKLGQTGFRTWLRTSAYTIQQVTHFLCARCRLAVVLRL